MRAWSLLILGTLGVGCGSDSTEPAPYDASITSIRIEIDYAPGAEPYVGGTGGFSDIWRIFGDNAQALFPGRTVSYPSTLEGMEAIAAPSGDNRYDVDELLALAEAHRTGATQDAERSYYILFLDGVLEEDGEAQEQVLGVSLGNTGVIAMFKPVIEGAGGSRVARFVEQATLVHELGHAVGLVNNGLPLTSDHHDAEHGAHCSNRDCVMYYLNEGLADLRDFAVQVLTAGETNLFDSACLGDVSTAYEPL